MRPWVAWEQAMLYKQYDAMDAGRTTAPRLGSSTRATRRCRGPGWSRPAASTPASGGPRTWSCRTGSARPGSGFVWNRDAKGHHYADRPFASWLRTARDYGVNEVVFGVDEGQDPHLAPRAGRVPRPAPHRARLAASMRARCPSSSRLVGADPARGRSARSGDGRRCRSAASRSAAVQPRLLPRLWPTPSAGPSEFRG